MDTNDLKKAAGNVLNKATDYSGSTSRKTAKGILGVIIVILLGALGLETTNNDWDLGKLMNGASPTEAKVMRDTQGNVVTDGTGKATNEYNCVDFKTQPEAQKFFMNAGGKTKDTNGLDGDNNGVACQDLPKGN
jgi:uncharacterized lipoprotein YehR (DUF1307 family)